MNAQRAAYTAASVITAWLAYEWLRVRVADAARRTTPRVVREKLDTRAPALALLAPLLGTVAVSEATGVLAEEIVLQTLPTLIGPKSRL